MIIDYYLTPIDLSYYGLMLTMLTMVYMLIMLTILTETWNMFNRDWFLGTFVSLVSIKSNEQIVFVVVQDVHTYIK